MQILIAHTGNLPHSRESWVRFFVEHSEARRAMALCSGRQARHITPGLVSKRWRATHQPH